MARKYDWVKLKAKYLSGSYTGLKQFADKENINYQVVRNNAKEWNEKKLQCNDEKVTKIVTKTIEKIAERESDRNAKHLMVWDKILNKIDRLANMDKIEVPTKQGDVIEIDVTHKHLAELSSAMDRVQKGQRLAEGLDKEDKANDAVAKSNERIMRIAELLNSPVNDRKINDFEEE
jgi:hypothetical protein